MKLGKTVLVGSVILIALAVLGQDSKKDGTTKAKAKPPVAVKATPVKIGQLLADYKANEVGADALYDGRYIEVKGFVSDVKKDLFGGLYITLDPRPGMYLCIPQVQASFKDGHAGTLAKLRKGQMITIRGWVNGLMMNVQMKKCIVL